MSSFGRFFGSIFSLMRFLMTDSILSTFGFSKVV
ncbi:hypothetical protein STANM309S_03710 [Streptomyces tanashiensis]